jgi:hypothetical protein
MHGPALQLLDPKIPKADTLVRKTQYSCHNADKGYSSTPGDFASESFGLC